MHLPMKCLLNEKDPMINLKEAQKTGNMDQFISEREGMDGNMDVFNSILKSSCKPVLRNKLIDLVNKQANDSNIWKIPETELEELLQDELHKLHSLIESENDRGKS